MANGFSSCGVAVISTLMTQNRSDGGDKLYPGREFFFTFVCECGKTTGIVPAPVQID